MVNGVFGVAICGDRNVDAGEECDDGSNGNDTDGCFDDCTFTFCGDSVVQSLNGFGGFEQCELPNAGVCDSQCQFKELTCVEALNLGLVTGFISGGNGIVTKKNNHILKPHIPRQYFPHYSKLMKNSHKFMLLL